MELAVEKPENITQLYDENTGLWKFVRADKGPTKSVELIEKALHRLGLSKNEIRVYLHIARTGEHKASEISETLSLHRTETYRILRDLQKKGLISSVFEKPLKFLATPFEKAMDALIEARKMRLSLLERRKQSLVELWLSLPKTEVEPERKEVFQILEGEDQAILKADELLNHSRTEILAFVAEQDISSFYNSSLLDKLGRLSRGDVKVQMITAYSPKNCYFLDKLKLKKVKFAASGAKDLPTFILVDDQQLLLLIRKDNSKKRTAALWTNYNALIRTLKTLFTELWTKES